MFFGAAILILLSFASAAPAAPFPVTNIQPMNFVVTNSVKVNPKINNKLIRLLPVNGSHPGSTRAVIDDTLPLLTAEFKNGVVYQLGQGMGGKLSRTGPTAFLHNHTSPDFTQFAHLDFKKYHSNVDPIYMNSQDGFTLSDNLLGHQVKVIPGQGIVDGFAACPAGNGRYYIDFYAWDATAGPADYNGCELIGVSVSIPQLPHSAIAN